MLGNNLLSTLTVLADRLRKLGEGTSCGRVRHKVERDKLEVFVDDLAFDAFRDATNTTARDTNLHTVVDQGFNNLAVGS